MYMCGGGMPMMGAGGGMPMIPAAPNKRSPPPCADDDGGNARFTAELGIPFIEELTKIGDCKKISAVVNGKKYDIKLLCGKDKKKTSPSGSCNGGPTGPAVKLCDCNIPSPGLCDSDEGKKKLFAKEERMKKNLSVCMRMMREMYLKNYDQQQSEDAAGVRMIEVPVMVMPGGGMGGMGMMGGMPGMGMPGMGMMGGMPGMGMPGMGIPGMGMPGMGMPGGAPYPGKRRSPCDPPGDDEPRLICKTSRDIQTDEAMPKPGSAKGKGGKGKKK